MSDDWVEVVPEHPVGGLSVWFSGEKLTLLAVCSYCGINRSALRKQVAVGLWQCVYCAKYWLLPRVEASSSELSIQRLTELAHVEITGLRSGEYIEYDKLATEAEAWIANWTGYIAGELCIHVG